MSLRMTATRIAKGYAGVPVLDDCSFSFEEKGIYVLTGPNGSGKSTFLRICSLLEAPDSGMVSYFSNGEALPHDISLRRRITIMLPRIGVFNTSVIKNVLYGLAVRGIGHREGERRGNEVLEFVGLEDKRNQNALTLSSGETQRLGLARALVIEPEILFLDEPTASVDRKNTAAIEDIILRLRSVSEAIIVMTTHDQEQARRLADHRIAMLDGCIRDA